MDADESGVGADEWGVGEDEWGVDTDGRTWLGLRVRVWVRSSRT